MEVKAIATIISSVVVLINVLGPLIAWIWKGAFNTVGKVVDGHYGRKPDKKKKYDPEEQQLLKAINKNSANSLNKLSHLPDDELRRQERQHNLDKKILQDDLYLSQKQDDFEWKKQKRIWEQEDRERRKQSGGSKKWHKK